MLTTGLHMHICVHTNMYLYHTNKSTHTLKNDKEKRGGIWVKQLSYTEKVTGSIGGTNQKKSRRVKANE